MAIAKARPIRPLTMRDGLRLSVVEGSVATVQSTFTTGVILTGFALMLGAEPWVVGLLAAIPALGQMAQLAAAWFLGRYGHRKSLCVWGAAVSRYLWLPIAVIPFLPIGTEAKLALFFTLMAISNALGQMAGIAWSDWMADAVPADIRGRYFGARNAIAASVGMAALVLGTRFLDGYDGSQAHGFFWLLAIAVACGGLCHVLLALQPEPPATPRPVKRGLSAFAAPLKHPGFKRLLAVMVAWAFVTTLTAPFTYAYAMQALNVSYGALGMHAMILTALGVVSQPLWGKAIDRFGAQKVLGWCMVPMTLHPLYWLVLTPTFTMPIWIDAASSGIFWSGTVLATSALLMEASPAGERAGYMGLYNTATGVAASLAALGGGLLLTALGDRTLAVGPWALVGLQVMCLVGWVLRSACVAAFMRLSRVAVPTLTITVREAAPVSAPALASDQ